jgi:hypothetical protein
LPIADQALVLKLLIEADEKRFRRNQTGNLALDTAYYFRVYAYLSATPSTVVYLVDVVQSKTFKPTPEPAGYCAGSLSASRHGAASTGPVSLGAAAG